MPAGLHLRAVLPGGGAAAVRQRPPHLRRQQRRQDAKRHPAAPAARRRELPHLRGGGAYKGPRLRLRRRHLRAAAPRHPPPEGAGRHQRRSYAIRHRKASPSSSGISAGNGIRDGDESNGGVW